MRKILADLYGVDRSRHRKKSLKEWLEDEIKAAEQEITTTRNIVYWAETTWSVHH